MSEYYVFDDKESLEAYLFYTWQFTHLNRSDFLLAKPCECVVSIENRATGEYTPFGGGFKCDTCIGIEELKKNLKEVNDE